MAMVSAFAKLAPKTHPVPLILSSYPNSSPTFFKIPSHSSAATLTRPLFSPSFVLKDDRCEVIPTFDQDEIEEEEEDMKEGRETLLYSFTPLPFLLVAALPGAGGAVRSLFGPFVELVKSWTLPDWLVRWGHPGNMAVVLFAMGGYGTYLGFRIRFSEDVEEKAKAKDLHPKLLVGMFFFFALGATGGITSLLTSDSFF